MKRMFAMAAVVALMGVPALAQDSDPGAAGSSGAMAPGGMSPSHVPETGAAATPSDGPVGPAASDQRAPGSADENTSGGTQAPATGATDEGMSGASGATDAGAAPASDEAKPMKKSRRHARHYRHHGRGMAKGGDSADAQVKALNLLASQGYRPTGAATEQDGKYSVPVTKDGQASTVTVDPASGTVQ